MGMKAMSFPLAGQRFEVDYGALVAANVYAEDGRSLTYAILGGALAGNTAAVAFNWRHLPGGSYAISWQEDDGSTAIQIDNFELGSSLAFFTTPDGRFSRLEGSLKPMQFAHQSSADNLAPLDPISEAGLDNRATVGIGLAIARTLAADGPARALVTHDTNRQKADLRLLGLQMHFAETYGGLRRAKLPENGGLATWQERRAKEIMQARLSSELTIAQVAQECRLTPSHFARAFRRSTGVAPHRYLMQLRVDEAKRLLQSRLPLADIALICGFGDQSHFTRVFGQVTGGSPGAWRRAKSIG
jgi:transcriptional regulator GlxA family with amidase domain